MSKPYVQVYTDGSASGQGGRHGRGGWGAVIIAGPLVKEVCGGDAYATANKMELTAVAEALASLEVPCTVDLYCDKAEIVHLMSKGKAKVVGRHGGLWKEILHQASRHDVSWHYVPSHCGIEMNERADVMAKLGRDRVLNGNRERITTVWRFIEGELYPLEEGVLYP